MKRVLCVRFPNWPIQRLQRALRLSGRDCSALALHTAVPGMVEKGSRKSTIDEGTRFVRGLFPSAISGPVIVAVSAEAWARGVWPGMPLAEARSMALPLSIPNRKHVRKKPQCESAPPAVAFHEWQPHRDCSELKAVAELTRRYAPIVGLDDVPMPDSLLLDITGCAPLFGGEAVLAESLLRDLRQAGWTCRIAVAHSVATVWALTHSETPPRQLDSSSASHRHRAQRRVSELSMYELPIQIVPPGQHRSEINPLPVAAARLILKDLEILSHLGIRSVGQLLSLPLEDLPARFSAQAVVRVQQLLDVIDEAIEPLPEADPVSADWTSDEPAAGVNDFRQILKFLTERIEEQLQRRRLACSSVACQFRCVNGSTVPLTASVVKPTQSAVLLQEVLCLRLETELTLAALEESARQQSVSGCVSDEYVPSTEAGRISALATLPVHAVSMMASVSRIPAPRQRDLFSADEHTVPQEELALLINRLSSRLGPEAVVTVHRAADPRPEFSVRTEPVLPLNVTALRHSQLEETLQILTEPISSTNAVPHPALPRPLRLLPVPLLVPAESSGRHFPTRAIVSGNNQQLARFSWPERIQTAWWTDRPCHRDYYQVTTTSGARLWLYRDLRTGGWFLHGIFE